MRTIARCQVRQRLFLKDGSSQDGNVVKHRSTGIEKQVEEPQVRAAADTAPVDRADPVALRSAGRPDAGQHTEGAVDVRYIKRLSGPQPPVASCLHHVFDKTGFSARRHGGIGRQIGARIEHDPLFAQDMMTVSRSMTRTAASTAVMRAVVFPFVPMASGCSARHSAAGASPLRRTLTEPIPSTVPVAVLPGGRARILREDIESIFPKVQHRVMGVCHFPGFRSAMETTRHIDTSLAMAELSLLPAVRKAGRRIGTPAKPDHLRGTHLSLRLFGG